MESGGRQLDTDVVADWRVHDGEVYVENPSGVWFRIDAESSETTAEAPPEDSAQPAGTLGWATVEAHDDDGNTYRFSPPACPCPH